jgi:murein DD-endopeptidase MepM/ murein hydrolase activator NlpD
VVSAGWNGEFGNMVEVDHGFGVVTRYAHLSRINVRVGDVLTPRQPLGMIGATGRATGAHLHYEIRVAGRAIDPLKFLHAAEVR